MTLLARLLNSTTAYLPLFEGEGAGAGAGAAPPVVGTPAPAAGTPPAGGAAPPAGGSFLANVDGAVEPGPGPAAFPDNWRDLMAGDDKAARPALDRFKAPGDVFKSWREAAATISKGVKGPERPADDQVDALKAWRESVGIPADPTGYTIADPVGKRFTDAEKPTMELFLAGMHKRDMAPAAVNAALDVYADMQDQVMAGMKASDLAANTACQDDLRQEWGKDFKINSTAARDYAAQLTPGVAWFEARLPDGSLLGSHPEIVKMFATLAKSAYGDTAFVGSEGAKKTESRMTEIKAMMADPASDWHKAATRQALYDEYSELLDRQSRAQTRSGAAPDRA